MTAEQTRYESGHEYRCEGCARIVNPDREPSPGEPVTCGECTPVESDADLLRRAAGLMRERAEATLANVDEWYDPTEMLATLRRGDINNSTQPHDATHIASWHPAVALAVADWLDAYAERMEVLGHAIGSNAKQALTVARTYLGEQP